MKQSIFKHFDRWGGQLFLGLLVMGLGIVLGRCWQLQYVEGTQHQVRADRQMLKVIPQTARRGSIVDRQGRYLAMSIRMDSVRADPAIIEDLPKTAQKICQILDLPENDLYQKLQDHRDRRFMWIKRYIRPDQAHQIRTLKIRGIVIEREYKRQYPMGELAAHVLGFTTIDGMGLEGIEASCDEYLTGKIGLWRLNSDALRRPIGTQKGSEPAQQGNNVVLCLDAMIQSYVEEQLVLTVEKYNAKGAIGIAMNPHTGEILALANRPTFDPATARQSIVEHRRNRALTDPIEPGSTFKPFTVAAALDGDYVSVHQTFNCENGSYSGRGFGKIGEYSNHSYGNLTVAQIVVNSSNIGTAKIAQKMGKSYFHDMVRKFGFGQTTGIDLTGESRGIFKPLDQWDRAQYDLTRLSFGQGPIMVTPIQLITSFCCLANGGVKVQPRVVRGILDQQGGIVEDFLCDSSPAPGAVLKSQRVVSPRVAQQIVTEVMTKVVEREGGSAHNAYLDEYRVFGKTGTAQVARSDGRGYDDNKYVSSFIGGAPAENPQLCVLVMVREPDRSLGLGYTGGMIAAPAVREIIRQTLSYLEVPTRLEK